MLKLTPSVLAVPRSTPLFQSERAWIKCEGAQRTGSVKYRMVYKRVQRALRQRLLRPGQALIEATAGSTGVALAHIGEQLGQEVELHIYEHCSNEKQQRMRQAGAHLVVHKDGVPFPDILHAITERVSSGQAWHLNQYHREKTIRAYRTFALEILNQWRHRCEQPISHLVAPIGTGGLIQGLGTVFRQQFPELKVIAIEPALGHSIDGLRNTECFHQGQSDPYDLNFPDQVIRVPAPKQRSMIHGFELGGSAEACYQVIQSQDWPHPLMIAADAIEMEQ